MRRPFLWFPLLIGWLPVWALYTLMIVTAHAGSNPVHAGLAGLRAVIAAALLGLAVGRLTTRLPWPRRVSLGFAAIHLTAAGGYAVSWIAIISLIESALRAQLVVVSTPNGLIPFLILGIWLYVMVAGISYAARATDRAVRAEESAAQAELAALRAQLNPHFLFNTLHTVVQLIPREPDRAARAAEQLASLLRTTLERDRDVIRLGEELAFVDQYLDLERIRFGDRLEIRRDIAEDTLAAEVPAFALQTLVENAVRHGATPKLGPTTIDLFARSDGAALTLRVTDDGAGGAARRDGSSTGTGLKRLRDRLQVLYGPKAALATSASADGFVATVTIPTLGDS